MTHEPLFDPDDPVLRSEAAEPLGEPEAALQTSRRPLRPNAIRIWQRIAFVLTAVGLVIGIVLMFRNQHFTVAYLIPAGFFGFFSLMSFLGIAQSERAHSRRLVIGKNGIALFELGEGSVILWTDLREVLWWAEQIRDQYAQVLGLKLFLKLRGRNYTLIEVHSFEYPHLDWVRERVQAELVRQQLPGADAAFRTGQPVEFGDVTIDQNELTVAGTKLAWLKVRRVRAEGAYLEATRVGGKVVRVDAGKVPNLAVCLALIDRILETVQANLPEDSDDLNFDR